MATFAIVAGLSLTTGCPSDDEGTTAGNNNGSSSTGTDPSSTTETDPPPADSSSSGMADGSSSSDGGGPPFGGQEDVDLANELWMTIGGATQDYANWAQITGLEGVVDSAAPHADYAEIYINDVAEADDTFPDGSILVKENVTDEMGENIDAVTIMVRRDGYEPSAGDWFWAKYLPDGTLDMNANGVPLAGRVGLGGDMGCIPCHSGAMDDDFVFSNDP
ncbi:MAG: cytochrome P460 family protein [Myxococcota bacterium]